MGMLGYLHDAGVPLLHQTAFGMVWVRFEHSLHASYGKGRSRLFSRAVQILSTKEISNCAPIDGYLEHGYLGVLFCFLSRRSVSVCMLRCTEQNSRGQLVPQACIVDLFVGSSFAVVSRYELQMTIHHPLQGVYESTMEPCHGGYRLVA